MKTFSSLTCLISLAFLATACGGSKGTATTANDTANNDCFTNNGCNIVNPIPDPTPDPTNPPDPPSPPSPNTPNGSGNNSPPGNNGTNNGSGNGNSFASEVKDVDLRKADAEAKNDEDRARGLADHFQMSLDAARSLTKLSDQMSRFEKSGSGQLTDEDREALSKSALSVAGVPADEVNAAVAALIKTGDRKPVDDLIERGAANLGMPSSSGLRDQILPSLGISY